MGNCVSVASSSKRRALPIDAAFKLPSPLPDWPPGGGFASGTIDLGGLLVHQVTSFTKIWAAYEGGPNGTGATFFEPGPIPEGFFLLGFYAQPNNQALYGWVLVGKDVSNDDPLGPTLKSPVDYTLVWTSQSLSIKQDSPVYIWVPVPPNGYQSVGHIITMSLEKPSLEKVRCVRSDLTDQCEADRWIWGLGTSTDPNGFNVFGTRPINRGVQALGVSVGTFIARNGTSSTSIACLKNAKNNFSCMPNAAQIDALFQAYSPRIYFHPNEGFLPSSVSWFFSNGALLYQQGQESKLVPIDPDGSNLPQGGSNDGSYWLDLPANDSDKERVKKGDLQNTRVYLHAKPMLGATFTDIAIWVFYPFNGPVRAKVGPINLALGKIGEHVGDWEHLTLRISNFNGELRQVYFSEHSSGKWVQAPELEFQNGNKPVAYASLHGHAFYSKPGLVLQGNDLIGIRNDTAKSTMFIDTDTNYSIVAAEYLGSDVSEPSWVNYYREWGPKINYDINKEVKDVEKVLPVKTKKALEQFVNSLPRELLGEEGPTSPKVKRNWYGDEV